MSMTSKLSIAIRLVGLIATVMLLSTSANADIPPLSLVYTQLLPTVTSPDRGQTDSVSSVIFFTADLNKAPAAGQDNPFDNSTTINEYPLDHSETLQVENDHAINVPLPAAALLFGSAFAGLIGISYRNKRHICLLPSDIFSILGIRFSIINYQDTIDLFKNWVDSGLTHQVCAVNVHTLVSSREDAELRRICNSTNTLNVMDGLPLVWYTKWVHNKPASRVCGPDLMLECLDKGREFGWKHFFLGGKPEVLNDLMINVAILFPGIEIAGWFSPPFRSLTAQEDADLIKMINDAKPDFLWVGLGAPKQEKWIASHLQHIHVPVQLGVGAAFDFHAEHVKRAPATIQKCGLEWLYRMTNDKRLITRYLKTNPVFLLLFFRDIILSKFFRSKFF